MKSSILIPSYLWKNTFKRWLEHPVSPLSKVIIPILLSLLATLVLVFLVAVESQLRIRLEQGDSYSVYITEHILPNDHISMTAQQSLAEQAMWSNKYGHEAISYIRQPIVSVRWGRRSTVPVILYSHYDKDLAFNENLMQTSESLFLTKNIHRIEEFESVQFNGVIITAKRHPMPERINKILQSPQALAVPIVVDSGLLKRGSTTYIHAHLSSLEQVRSFVSETRAYASAERRHVKIFSALDLLENIEKLKKMQAYVRVGIVIGCGLILSIILGTIAWLEFRQESYLMALLRSFGAPRWLILAHAFFENLILVALGIGVASLAWQPIYSFFQSRLSTFDLQPVAQLRLPFFDLSIIILAAFLGVLAAMLPIAFGLRKQAGLILQ